LASSDESLHRGDRELLLKMISETRNHDESSFDLMSNSKESEDHIMYFLFTDHDATAMSIK
jgi:hypothetical protein